MPSSSSGMILFGIMMLWFIQDILINPDFGIDNITESDCDDISDKEDKI